jgi:Na+/H+ antiporter NhaD/arsenite permease-like protein
MDLTTHWVGYLALAIFVIAYGAVITEEFTHLRKSKPVVFAAGLIWALIAYAHVQAGMPGETEEAVLEFLAEFAELFMFLLTAMTYVNAMTERNVFEALRAWLVRRAFGYRAVFWITGVIAFFLSPVVDNLTTALILSAVVIAVGQDNKRFITLSCINIVVAANAGGAFSPFGDITTLMVWQRGIIDFWTFTALFLPAVVNFVVPAAAMTLAVPKGAAPPTDSAIRLKRGAKTIMFLFACTIITTVSFHNYLQLPAFLGMTTGLAYLKFFGYYLRKTHKPTLADREDYGDVGDVTPFDSFRELARVEWDTLIFFFGIIMSVGGLSFVGYLDHLSEYLYGDLGATTANFLIGSLSAIVDNIPIMVGVLEMNPDMDTAQWLLVTLTTGVGGSMLSIGSAAGVALMGQARGIYTFFGHLKWTPAIVLGYLLSIWTHLAVNAALASVPAGG